jgi:hypothetical protein
MSRPLYLSVCPTRVARSMMLFMSLALLFLFVRHLFYVPDRG